MKAIEEGNSLKPSDLVFLDVVDMNEYATAFGFGGVFILLIIICMISMVIISTCLQSHIKAKGKQSN